MLSNARAFQEDDKINEGTPKSSVLPGLSATPTCCEYHKDGPIRAFVYFTTAARICSQYSHRKEVDNQSQEHLGANATYS